MRQCGLAPRDPVPITVTHLHKAATFGGSFRSTVNGCVAERTVGISSRILFTCDDARERHKQYAQSRQVRCNRLTSASLASLVLHTRISSNNSRHIVHLHSGLDRVPMQLKLLRQLLGVRLPIVVSMHGTMSLFRVDSDPIQVHTHLEAAEFADCLIVPSDTERDRQIRLGLPPAKCAVVPDLVLVRPSSRSDARRRLQVGASDLVIGFCGRLVPEKGISMLAEVFVRLAAHYPSLRLVIAGTGPLEQHIRHLVDRVESRVVLLGLLDDPSDVYWASDIVVCPSIGESFGMVAYEAMHCGCATILTSITPWTSVFSHREHCLFVSPGDRMALEESLIGLLTDSALRSHLGHQASSKIKLINGAHVIGGQLLDTYTTCLRRQCR